MVHFRPHDFTTLFDVADRLARNFSPEHYPARELSVLEYLARR